MPDYPVIPGTLPSGWCPETWQAVLNEFSSLMAVTVPAAQTIVIADAEPSASDRDKLWVKTTAGAPYSSGLWIYKGGAWQPVLPIQLYFADTGVANAMVITTGQSIASAAFLGNRLFLIRVAAQNTGATTLKVDNMAALAVKKTNGTDLASGDIKAGQLLLIAYDPNDSVYELLTIIPDATPSQLSWATSTDYAIPAPGNAITVTHTFGKVPEIIRVVAVCQVATNGYVAGNEVAIEGITADINAGDEDVAAYTVSADSGAITIAACTATNGQAYTAKSGGFADWGAAYPNFKFRVYMMAFP